MVDGIANEKEYNWSLACIRVLMTFVVILCHFWIIDGAESGFIPGFIICKLKPIAVPIFMLVSFYLLEKHTNNCDYRFIGKRIFRLLYPFIAWGVIYYLVILGSNLLFHIELCKIECLTLESLGWQLLLGSSRYLCPPLWYQVVLLIWTVASLLVFKRMGDKAYQVLIFISLFAWLAQYAGWNFLWFSELEYEAKWTLGRVLEMVPYVAAGLLLSKRKLIDSLQQYKSFVCVGLLILLIIDFNYSLFSVPQEGFGYAGTELFFEAVIIFIVFMLLPLANMPFLMKKIVFFLAKYSFGVYCVHYLVGRLVNYFLEMFAYQEYVNRFRTCILIWVLCYLIAYGISCIPFRFAKQLVQ